MTTANKIVLAGKFLRTHFRRHVFIVAILAFSFAVVMTATTTTAGMEENVFHAGENHYGGHVFLFGYDRPIFRIRPVASLLRTIDSLHMKPTKIALRTLSYDNGILHFAGRKMRLKYVFGMDWESEKAGFRDQAFADRSFPETLGANGIIISAPIAADLHARRGDGVILELATKDGQKNTGTFIVRGIIDDKSVFGYFKCYVDRKRLNALVGFDPGDCSWIGLYFAKHDAATLAKKATRLYAALRGKYPVLPPAVTREEFAKVFDQSADKLSYPVFTLFAYISQVSDLLVAVEVVMYFLFVTMIIIAIASMSVSMRLMLHERAREIGTLRVMGLGVMDIHVVLLMEAAMAFLLSLCLGLALSFIFNWVLSLFSYDRIPGFEIFLRQGKLSALYAPGTFFINTAVFLAATLPAAWLAIRRISSARLISVLSGETF
jgi:putative ABC transport system permease protein